MTVLEYQNVIEAHQAEKDEFDANLEPVGPLIVTIRERLLIVEQRLDIIEEMLDG